MNDRIYRLVLWALALGFTAVFAVVVGPPLIESGDILGAFAAGFVNPFSSGYSLDVFFTWAVLAAWVIHERRPHGWIALVLGVVPGVAVGLAAYLLIRARKT